MQSLVDLFRGTESDIPSSKDSNDSAEDEEDWDDDDDEDDDDEESDDSQSGKTTASSLENNSYQNISAKPLAQDLYCVQMA